MMKWMNQMKQAFFDRTVKNPDADSVMFNNLPSRVSMEQDSANLEKELAKVTGMPLNGKIEGSEIKAVAEKIGFTDKVMVSQHAPSGGENVMMLNPAFEEALAKYNEQGGGVKLGEHVNVGGENHCKFSPPTANNVKIEAKTLTV
jgi:hypothetical protein